MLLVDLTLIIILQDVQQHEGTLVIQPAAGTLQQRKRHARAFSLVLRRRRHLRCPNPAHDDEAGGGPAPRRVLAAVAARAPGIQRASTDARRVQLGRAECDERYPVRWKEVLLPIAA